MIKNRNDLKRELFEFQNLIFRKKLQKKHLPKSNPNMVFIGNEYSGYWFPQDLVQEKGTIWGVGLGLDSSFEEELLKLGYTFCGFEPEIGCFNASLKQFSGTPATIENFGLWDKTGTFSYSGENISIVNIFNLPEMSKEKLNIRSLWEVTEEKKIRNYPSPRILKLNIEGAEREILIRYIEEPLDFDVIIFQAEFLFHIPFKRIIKKISAYNDMKKILVGFHDLGWHVLDFSRHQITISKQSQNPK